LAGIEKETIKSSPDPSSRSNKNEKLTRTRTMEFKIRRQHSTYEQKKKKAGRLNVKDKI
jgi:hypothetical protein